MVVESRWRVNLLCLLGALMGFASLFMVWGIVEGTNDPEWPLRDFIAMTSYRDWAKPSASLFLIGFVIAFITPLGGLLEIAGVTGFLIAVVPDLDGGGIGIYVGATSALIVISSMVVPLGPGYKRGMSGLERNFLTFSPVIASTLRLNLLCVIGAVIGLVAMLTPLVSEHGTEPPLFSWLFYYTFGSGGYSTLTVSYAAHVFLIGTLMALVSPAGGVLQAGSAGYLATTFGNSHIFVEGIPNLGFFLAVTAAVVVLSSAVRPWGPGWKGLKPGVADRLRTWARGTPAPTSSIDALKTFLSIPYSPRKAFTEIVVRRNLWQALVLILVSTSLTVIIEFLLVGHFIESTTILYGIHLHYSHVAWIVNEFSGRLSGFLGTILLAFLIVETTQRSGKPFGGYFSALGYFTPWNCLAAMTLVVAWHSLWDAGSVLIYGLLLLPASIWLLWLAGTAISVAGEVRVSTGILAGLAAAVCWSFAAATLGWLMALAFPVIWFAWKTHRRRVN